MLLHTPLKNPHQPLKPKTNLQHRNTDIEPNKSTPIIYTYLFCKKNLNTFEERHASLSEQLTPDIYQALRSAPQYEPTYNLYPSLQ